MKITAPKDPDEYFRQTDHAVKHSYASLDSCWLYYRQALQHWDISQVGQPMTPERTFGEADVATSDMGSLIAVMASRPSRRVMS